MGQLLNTSYNVRVASYFNVLDLYLVYYYHLLLSYELKLTKYLYALFDRKRKRKMENLCFASLYIVHRLVTKAKWKLKWKKISN